MADDPDRSFAALTRYDVLLVNAVRDGLNLVAKEGPLVNDNDGVLVLSREAGAFEELQDAALAVNPFDVADTADVLAEALAMAAGRRHQFARRLLVGHRHLDDVEAPTSQAIEGGKSREVAGVIAGEAGGGAGAGDGLDHLSLVD